MFKKLVFVLVLSFALFGCGSSSGGNNSVVNVEEPSSVVATIELKADKTTITADGTETVTLSVVAKDKDNVIITGANIDYYEGSTKLTGNTFKTTTAGTYNITAKSGTVTSNVVTITANNAINKEKDYKILETENNTCEIVDYLGLDKQITIPEKINGKMVTSIGEKAFVENKLTSVIIPNSIITIKYGAFANNELINVTISNKITSIGDYAFFSNKLTSIIIPESVISIGNSTFSYNLLTNIKIPNNVTNIGENAFAHNKLRSAIIPESVISIGSSAFSFNLLTNVEIPNSIISISGGVFWANQLTSVTIPNSVTNIGELAFSNNQLISVTIPNSITTIDKMAFSGNKLTSVTIPNSVTSIDDFAFSNNQLISVTIPSSVMTVGTGAFSGNSSLTICVKSGSAAETYAKNNKIPFIAE